MFQTVFKHWSEMYCVRLSLYWFSRVASVVWELYKKKKINERINDLGRCKLAVVCRRHELA